MAPGPRFIVLRAWAVIYARIQLGGGSSRLGCTITHLFVRSVAFFNRPWLYQYVELTIIGYATRSSCISAGVSGVWSYFG